LENAAEFAQCVTDGTGGEITITTHPDGSLYGGVDIKRAIQTGQVPIGERLLSAHANENAVFAYDNVPFLATSFDDAGKAGPDHPAHRVQPLCLTRDDEPRDRIHHRSGPADVPQLWS